MAEGRCGGGDGAVELSLRLRTGDDGGTSVAAPEEEAAARRSMTIFYNGRVCAVNVTELQARTIISMANHQGNFTKQHQRRVIREDDHHHYHQADSSRSNSGSVSTAAQQQQQPCVAGSSQNPAAAVPSPPRQRLEEAAAPMMNQAAEAANGLSMKRSLQRFLEKRKTRAAAAAAPLYAGDRPVAQPMRRY